MYICISVWEMLRQSFDLLLHCYCNECPAVMLIIFLSALPFHSPFLPFPASPWINQLLSGKNIIFSGQVKHQMTRGEIGIKSLLSLEVLVMRLSPCCNRENKRCYNIYILLSVVLAEAGKNQLPVMERQLLFISMPAKGQNHAPKLLGCGRGAPNAIAF